MLGLGILLTAGRAQAQTVPAAKHSYTDLAGCYRLMLGPWSTRVRSGPPSPTETFRLDTPSINNRIPGARAATRVTPAELVPASDPRAKWLQPSWWRMMGADSIEITTWSITTESETFYGHVAGVELRGVLRNPSDAIPMDLKTRRIKWDVWPWARATARRVACP
jgi:hypothetical protein